MKDRGIMNGIYIHRELEYYPIFNRHLLNNESCASLAEMLGAFLRQWK